ncbi:MAG: snoRNA-binding rRNA-processing protein utp10 [Piccolia ochrophora]|nr:MAG: snoRNA-binding rRNA-processing protein utp10 [Piccolia ochrophora]
MASKLSAQLSKIAAKSANSLDLKAQKAAHSQSLIFEPTVAATQDFETIYALCVEGFQELCLLDQRFTTFARTIFSEHSKDQDRMQMTEEENEDLNRVLEDFLRLVGARLLLRPAVKALDWLIRRFRVHEHNETTLLLTFLPYHVAPIFQTLLSILPRRLPRTFKFLAPYAKSLANPPRHVIVYSAINDRRLVALLNAYVLQAAGAHQHHQTLLAFWSGVMTEALSGMLDMARSGRQGVQREREEDVLLNILPTLNEGLSFRKVPELRIACYTMLVVLSAKARLQDKLLLGMMQAVVVGWTRETVVPGLTCVAVLAQARERIDLPRGLMQRMMKVDGLRDHLLALSQHRNVKNLTASLLLCCIQHMQASQGLEYLGFIEEVLHSQLLDKKDAAKVVRRLFAAAQEIGEDDTFNERDVGRFGDLLVRLQSSDDLGKLVQTVMDESDADLDTLEMKLQTVFRRPQLENGADTEDVEMLDSHSVVEKGNPLDAAFSHLPTRTVDEVSFLDHTKSHLFSNLSQVFLLAAMSPSNLERLLNHPIMDRESALRGSRFFTFFIRIWCGPYPVLARSVALQTAAKQISSTQDTSIELQALLPYVLVAMADRDDKVRSAAAKVVVEVHNLMRRADLEPAKDKQVQIWGSSDMYGHGEATTSIQWLSARDSRRLVAEVMVPGLEECVLDQAHIAELMNAALKSRRPSQSSETAKSELKRLKTSQRESLIAFLGSHVNSTPLYNAKFRLLGCLNQGSKSAKAAATRTLLPSLRRWASLSAKDAINKCDDESIDAKKLEDQMVGIVVAEDQEGLSLLQELILEHSNTERPHLVGAALERLRQLWPSLLADSKTSVAQFLLDYSLSEWRVGAHDHPAAALDILRSLLLPDEVLMHFLDQLPTAAVQQDGPPAPKKPRKRIDTPVSLSGEQVKHAATFIRKTTFVLELVDSSEPETRPRLLGGLFRVLGEIQHVKTELGSELAYVQGLVLASLLSIVDAFKKTPKVPLERSAVRPDLLVDCIRSTTNSRVQSEALLIVSSLADIAPDIILHSVMPIFTFMGATFLRQDDEYSLHVIDQTISQVIPPLVQSLRRQNQDPVEGTADLLLSFVAAFEHIPSHRRLALFTSLVETLGAEDFLFSLLAMLADRSRDDKKAVTFAVQLAAQFSPEIQMISVHKYFDLVREVAGPNRKLSRVLLNLEGNSNHIPVVLQCLFELLKEVLSQRLLATQIADYLRRDDEVAAHIQTTMSSLLERILAFSAEVKDKPSSHNACGTTFEVLLRLLPTNALMKTIDGLEESRHNELRRKALRALEMRIQEKTRNSTSSRVALLEFLPRITALVQESSDTLLKHTAISCVDQIFDKYGKTDPASVETAAGIVAGSEGLGHPDDRLRVIALLCLTTAVEAVHARILPVVPNALSNALEYLDSSVEGNPQLHSAAYSFLGALMLRVPWIIIGKPLEKTLNISYRSAEAATDAKAEETRSEVLQLLAKQVEPKECFSSLEKSWPVAVSQGPLAVQALLEILKTCIERCPKSVIVKNVQVLKSILLHGFDLRRVQAEKELDQFDSEDVVGLGKTVEEVAIKVIFKLNDTTFRPLFTSILDWATGDSPEVANTSKVLKLTSVFGFLYAFFEALKSIVTGYAASVIDIGVDVLRNVDAADEHSGWLWVMVMRTFLVAFKHDQDDFWQAPSHFSAIEHVLISQLRHATTLPVIEEAIPAITELCKVVDSGEQHREMSSTLLKLMRDPDPLVRVAAVKCEESLTERLGEDWLSMLPEMLPFISELQEDDDEVVERETHRWIVQMEEVLGESLDSML